MMSDHDGAALFKLFGGSDDGSISSDDEDAVKGGAAAEGAATDGPILDDAAALQTSDLIRDGIVPEEQLAMRCRHDALASLTGNHASASQTIFPRFGHYPMIITPVTMLLVRCLRTYPPSVCRLSLPSHGFPDGAVREGPLGGSPGRL